MTVSSRRVSFDAEGLVLAGDWWEAAPDRAWRGTLVLLHGGGQTRHSWRRTAERFARLGWTAIALDTRGHGDSDWAPGGDYALDALVSDLHAVLDELAEPPVLVGASLGGMTSLVLEGESPRRARALVLVDVVARLEPEGVARIQRFLRSRPDGFESLEEAAAAIQAYTDNRDREVNLDGLRKNLRLREDGRWHWHWDPAFMFDDGSDRGHDRNEPERLRSAAANIAVPTLVLHGTNSDVVSARGVEELIEVLPHAVVADVSGTGHMVAGDDNDLFTERLAGFLDAHVPAASMPPRQASS